MITTYRVVYSEALSHYEKTFDSLEAATSYLAAERKTLVENLVNRCGESTKDSEQYARTVYFVERVVTERLDF